MAKIFLHGAGIQFYRGIGPEPQLIGPFSELNFFIGANNAGKSIVLNFIHERLPFKEGGKGETFEPGSPEMFRGEEEGKLWRAVGVPRRETLNLLSGSETSDQRETRAAELEFSQAVELICNKFGRYDLFWAEPSSHGPRLSLLWRAATTSDPELHSALNLVRSVIDKQEIRLWSKHEVLSGEILRILGHLSEKEPINLPPSKLIPAKRVLGPKDEAFEDETGKGLMDKLAQLQSPGHHERDLRAQFDAINALLQDVTGKPDAVIEVPHDKAYLQVHIENKVLPLDSLGSGIHEVILIAAFCTINQDQIICIEEPEIHLHPLLQRKLIAYLREHTTNQYFIATHSAAFIDTPGASVFRVTNDGVQTRVEPALLRDQKWRICDDLGVRASDILQANFVIWVEGPSDRIYLNHWLSAVAPELREGIDYTIMFYGGGLVAHLSADGAGDPVQDLIDLRSLNRNMAIVMDSDRASPHAHLKGAPKRLKDEAADDWAMVWITKGREIENYVDHAELQAALKSLHPKIYKAPLGGGPNDHAFHFERKGSTEPHKTGDKVGAARLIAQAPANLDILDLRARVTQLAEKIRFANGLAPSQPSRT